MERLKELEEEYLYKNTSYKVEQEFLYSYSKQELREFINDFRREYIRLRTPYSIKINKLKKSKNYINGNELEKFFLEQVLYFFDDGKEVKEKRKILEKLETFFKLNHTDFLKQNEFKKIDVNSIPIERIISYYTSKNFENTRKNYVCPFPDHRDKTASFHIYKNKNIFVCFGCHKKGNAINFISYMENINNKEAFKKFISLIK